MMKNLNLLDIDVNGLINFRKSDLVAEIIFKSFAKRQNNRKVTTVTRLYDTLRLAVDDISRRDIIRVFRKLQDLNCGNYIQGRPRGTLSEQSRFVWKASLVTVGRGALEEPFSNVPSEAQRDHLNLVDSKARLKVSVWLSKSFARLQVLARRVR
jgi:hypothetical protein